MMFWNPQTFHLINNVFRKLKLSVYFHEVEQRITPGKIKHLIEMPLNRNNGNRIRVGEGYIKRRQTFLVIFNLSKLFLKRGVLTRACDIYFEKYRGADGRVPATFQILYLSGRVTR